MNWIITHQPKGTITPIVSIISEETKDDATEKFLNDQKSETNIVNIEPVIKEAGKFNGR